MSTITTTAKGAKNRKRISRMTKPCWTLLYDVDEGGRPASHNHLQRLYMRRW